MADFQSHVERAKRDVQVAAAEFTQTAIPQYREKLAHVVNLERSIPFTGRCRLQPSRDELSAIYLEMFKNPLGERERDLVEKFASEVNMCSASQLRVILSDRHAQDQVDKLYRDVYLRPADPYARAYWRKPL